MKKKHRANNILKIVVAVILMILIAVAAVFCFNKIGQQQNEKNIIGTWVNGGSEEVFTFRENGTLILNQDMPEAMLSAGEASYSFVHTDTICVSQEDASVEFGVEVDSDQLVIRFMGQRYMVLQKQ